MTAPAILPATAHTRALGRVLDDLDTVANAELLDLFDDYDIPDEPMPAAEGGGPRGLDRLIGAIHPVVFKYAAGAALVTAQWYRELAPNVDYDPVPMFELPVSQVENSARWALFAPGDEAPLSRVAGSTQRQIYDASRSTVLGNARAEDVRWARVAAATACPWCRILATRGAVYRHEETAMAASHDRCECTPFPERPGTVYDPPDYVHDWDLEYMAARQDLAQYGIDTPNIDDIANWMRRGGGPPQGWEAAPGTVAPVLPPSPRMQALDKIARDFTDRTGIAIRSWDQANAVGVDTFVILDHPDLVGPFSEGIADMADKYPIYDRAQTVGTNFTVGTEPYAKDRAYAWMWGGEGSKGTTIRFNQEWTKDPKAYVDSYANALAVKERPHLKLSDGTPVRSAFHPPLGAHHPAWATGVHETGHVLDGLTGWRASNRANAELIKQFYDSYPKVGPQQDYGAYVMNRAADYKDWLYKNLPAYAFHDNGRLNAKEALAEAFQWVEAVGADKASEPARILHKLVTDEYAALQAAA